MGFGDYIQKEIISSRFILAVMVVAGLLYGSIDKEIAYIILAFYFGNVTKNTIKK
jgi:hypothetical protein